MTFSTGITAKPSGFTLLEVMLALTLFALLGTILYGAIALGHGAVERSRHSFEKNQELRSAVDLVGGYVRSSYPYRVSPQDPSFFYGGEETELSFISSFSLAMGGRGMAKIRLFWESQNGEEGALKLEEQVPVRLNDENGGGGYTHDVTIRDRVSAFHLAYLDIKNEEEEWVEKWDLTEHKTLPRAVRVSFRTPREGQVEWVFPIMMAVLAP
jgi:prepilin-type N-terminal cleavage/methylation domain-containing protein